MTAQRLGDCKILKISFDLEEAFTPFSTKIFKDLPLHKQRDFVSQTLCETIQKAPSGRFLLPAVMEFIEKIEEKKILDSYNFNLFELWLNQQSGLSFSDSYKIRSKIAGRFVPRDAYQIYFPIGMGRVYPGSHFVTAHTSPDLDTTVASFWGWIDAFAARVSQGLHVWNVPGGPPQAVEVDLLFYNFISKNLFRLLAKHRTSLSVSSMDLVTQTGLAYKTATDSTLALDLEKLGQAVVMVDQQGFYLGEWKGSDIENVRFVIDLLNRCLRWYENHFHVRLIAFFSKDVLTIADLSAFLKTLFEMKIGDCQPVEEFASNHHRLVEAYLIHVLKASHGLNETFQGLAKVMDQQGVSDFLDFINLAHSFVQSSFFSKEGKLHETRSHLFGQLATLIASLDKAILAIRRYVDQLGVALNVKAAVLKTPSNHVSYRADLDEIKAKLDSHSYITVTFQEEEGVFYPLGVIHASDLYKPTLGTVSLRDFSNREETKVPSFLEVISVIDHHKSSLTTTTPPVAIITDAQSSNALVAQMSFSITDAYTTGGMTREQIETQIQKIDATTGRGKRILQRLLQKSLNLQKEGGFFVAPEREITEYLQFLYAILDDTDLLSKVSARDVECVASLLNRLKSLVLGEEVEIIDFDDIPQGRGFAKAAAKKLLQNEDMYSLYRKVYHLKETSVAENILLCIEKKPSNIFADTKEQNKCCRVGQTKLFAKNVSTFHQHVAEVRQIWLQQSQAAYQVKNEVDLHLHMISTIAGAEEVYQGSEGNYTHEDELWLWIPETEVSIAHLKNFLMAFRTSAPIVNNRLEVDLLGSNWKLLGEIFQESFSPISVKRKEHNMPLAVLRFKAGSLNSRKTMISPYLPIL